MLAMEDLASADSVVNYVIRHIPLCRIKVRFRPLADIRMSYWIGSVLRNRFLYMSSKVYSEQGISLYEIIDTLPLSGDHFLYKYLKGGFPKGFVFDYKDMDPDSFLSGLDSDEIYSFSLVLIGSTIRYKSLFIQALRLTLESGFGHPMTPAEVIGIKECVEVDDVEEQSSLSKTKGNLQLYFITPVSLMHIRNDKSSNGFQNKLNNFPSLYQFIRSLTYRIITLYILYTEDSRFVSKEQIEQTISRYIDKASIPELDRAHIQYEKIRSTPKEGNNFVYTMEGYIGTLAFRNFPLHYKNLLSLGSKIGVGNNINYGMGQYDFVIR